MKSETVVEKWGSDHGGEIFQSLSISSYESNGPLSSPCNNPSCRETCKRPHARQ